MIRCIKIVTSFHDYDKDFEGDYAEVRVFVDGALVQVYGNHCDDKGKDKARGFVDGFRAAVGKNSDVMVEEEEVADYV